jgi:hypothetical protein
LTAISCSLFLLSLPVSFLLTCESSGVVVSISRQVFSFLSCLLYQVGLLILFDVWYRYVPHTSGTIDIYDPFRYIFIVFVSDL